MDSKFTAAFIDLRAQYYIFGYWRMGDDDENYNDQ